MEGGGKALGFGPVLFCAGQRPASWGSTAPTNSNGHRQASIAERNESRFQRSQWSLADKPRALPWAGMNDAVGVSNRPASGSCLSGTPNPTFAEAGAWARRGRANNPCKEQSGPAPTLPAPPLTWDPFRTWRPMADGLRPRPNWRWSGRRSHWSPMPGPSRG